MYFNRTLNLLCRNKFVLAKKIIPVICAFHQNAIRNAKTHGSLNRGTFSKSHKPINDEAKTGKDSFHASFINEMNEVTTTQLSLLREFIVDKSEATYEDWDLLLTNVLNNEYGGINESNVHGKIMEYCATNQKLNLAKSYLRYMKKNDKKFNQSVALEFLNVCYPHQNILDENDLKIVRIFTNHLLSFSEIIDLKMGFSLVKGLAILNDWRKCFDILRSLEKKSLLRNSFIFSPVISCLLNNHEFELARDTILECLTKKYLLQDQVYLEWVKCFHQDAARLEELLTIFSDYYIVPRKFVCDGLVQAFSELPTEKQFKGKFASVNLNGRCEGCGKTLQKNILSSREFKELQKNFLNRVLVGDNVYKNTTPEETNNFHKVVKNFAPFDIVIDGLNVMYCQGIHKSPSYLLSLLQKAIDYFFNRDKRIFVVLRKYITRSVPHKLMQQIQEKSTLFLIDDESEDDPFIIYAALYSGPKCYYVTKDYMRSEKFRLQDDRLSDLFKRWQLSHQIILNAEVQFTYPLKYKICVQKTSPQSWHIPYYDNTYKGHDLYHRSDFSKWLCLRG